MVIRRGILKYLYSILACVTLCGVNHSFRPTLTRAAVGRRATALPSSFANDRHLSGSTLKLHRRPSVGHVAVPSVCGPPGALSLMPEAVVCRRDDAAFFFLPRARRPDADAYRAAARRDQPRRLSAFRWLSSPVPAGRMQGAAAQRMIM